jgi:V8-like Glu-specific endopeptidase
MGSAVYGKPIASLFSRKEKVMKSKIWAKLFTFTIIVAVSLVLVTSAYGFSPNGQNGDDPNQVVSSGPTIQSAAEVEAYWTPDRMRDAKPFPMPSLSQDDIQAKGALDTEQASGPFVAVPGALPEGEPTVATQGEVPAVESGGDIEPLGYSYPPPFTRHAVFPAAAYRTYPYITVGKVFFTIPGKGDHVCSGSSAVGRAVWTAGHCVYTPGTGWHTNWAFVPAYKNGNAPYGIWPANELWSLNGWTAHDNNGYDIGMAVTTDQGGKKLSQRVGYLGFMANTSRRQHWHNLGYPQDPPFNGEVMQMCIGSHARNDANFSPMPVGMGCDLTGGASGGPWIVKFNPRHGAFDYVNGVNSYKYTKPWQPLQMYSPYFGNGAVNLYNTVKNR